MPTCLSIPQGPSFKKLKLLAVLLFSPLIFFGQTLTGLWTGALSSDSNTIRKDQLFEIALTEYRGKVYGYSRSEFIVNDTLYYILKRVKGTIAGDSCEVTDDEIVSYNFPGKLDKGVKVTSTFRRNKADSTWYLAGTWKTNATKKYYSLTGKVDLQEEKDLSSSKIFPHLEELRLADQVAFYKERKEGVPIVMRNVKAERVQTEYVYHPAIGEPVVEKKKFNTNEIEKPVTPIERKNTDPIVKAEIKEEKKLETKSTATEVVIEKKPETKATQEVLPGKKPETSTTDLAVEKKPDSKPIQTSTIVDNKTKSSQEKEITKPSNDIKTTAISEKKDIPIATVNVKTVKETKPATDISDKTVVDSRKAIEDIIQQTKAIGGRISEFAQEVTFKSDSLELSLYDNGEIDGDTVSVYINGELIMPHQGLKASAIKKTIYIKPGDFNDFTLVLFADNLGKYPPNTGLLVVHDGEDIYHLRFSSDLQKSSGIVFKRKK
jgi:hypothetical protein